MHPALMVEGGIHFWRSIIPMLPCEMPPVSIATRAFAQARGTIPIERVDTNGGNDHDETLDSVDAARLEPVTHHHRVDDHCSTAWPSCSAFRPFRHFANLQPLSLVGAAGCLELIGGALLILGLLHAAGSLHSLGRDGVRLFHRHMPKSFFPLINGGTLAIMFCFACLYLSTAGAGAVEPRRCDENGT